MAAQGYAVAISVVDNITGPLNAINKHIAAISAPVQRLNKSLAKFAEVSGLKAVSNGFTAVNRAAASAAGTLTRMLPVLSTITGAASIAGLFRLTEGWARLGTTLLNSGAILGLSVERLQEIRNGARLAGVSASDMESSMAGLNEALQGAKSGTNREAANLFAAYGVAIGGAGYQAASAGQKMGDAFEIIRKMTAAGASPATIQHAMSILGLSASLTRYAQQGKAGFERMNAEAQKYGYLSTSAAVQADRMREGLDRVGLATEGLGNRLATRLGPTLTRLLNRFADWIATSPKLNQMIEDFGNWLDGIDFDDVISGIGDWISKINDIVTAIGGWKVVAEGMLAVWAAPKLIGIATGLVSIGRALSNPVVLAALATWTAFYAQRAAGEKDAGDGEMARQMGLAVRSTDDAGHPTLYYSPQTGETVLPDDIKRRYDARNKLASAQPDSASQDDDWFKTKVNDWWDAHAPSWAGGNRGRRTKALAPDIEAEVRKQAVANDLDPDHMVSLVRAEGGGYDKTSSAGAYGPMQMMPATAKDLGIDLSDPAQRADWRSQVRAGVGYYAQQYRRYHNYHVADAAYNAGPNAGSVQQYAKTGDLSTLPSETQGYVKTIDRTERSIHAPVAAAASASGTLKVTIGAPAGYPVTADARGGVINGTPRILQPMTGFN